MAMMISWVARVNSSHPYLENDPSSSLVSHRLRISPWLRFSTRIAFFKGPEIAGHLDDDGLLLYAWILTILAGATVALRTGTILPMVRKNAVFGTRRKANYGLLRWPSIVECTPGASMR